MKFHTGKTYESLYIKIEKSILKVWNAIKILYREMMGMNILFY